MPNFIASEDKSRLFRALESVDYVTIFKDLTPLNVIKKIKPDVLVKGADWKNGNIVGSDFVIARGGKVKRAKFTPGCSTTELIKKIVKKS